MDIEKLVSEITQEVMNNLGRNSVSTGNNNISSYIDHTILKPDADIDAVKKVCDEAKKFGFASVCVNPSFLPFVAEQLAGSNVLPCCVIGFPLGATLPEIKEFEANKMIEAGAKELDMVANIGAIKSNNWDLVKKDIEAVVNVAKGRAGVKLIIETCLLSDEEKVKVCAIAKIVGVDFVKTSTGFSTGGATVEDVELMRKTVGANIGVKASGGVRDRITAQAMINAGANRLGTSSGIKIAQGAEEDSSHHCINCGACDRQCPTENVRLIKEEY